MKIKSAKSFRFWYKTKIKEIDSNNKTHNENFVGTYHIENSKKIKGFFEMYHGDKEDVRAYLSGNVEMAEDGQAIYEFVQNAADSDSTIFYMFYDKNYLIVLNNGKVFSEYGVKSILNIGQSFDKQDPDKIGRFGIGFKLVHRLIGASTGLDEMLNIDGKGHRGPILYSWNENSQFSNFLKTKSNEFDFVDFEDNNAPWLFKILITNFPAQPSEKVKDINYNDIEPFDSEELESFQTFLNSCCGNIDLSYLDSGTVFFLKLGNNKFDYLERQKQEYLNGLSTSMHFLKSLDTLVINENIVKKDKEATNVLEFTIQNGSIDFNEIGLTEIRDKESDAKFKICFADNANSAIEIKKHPNIYKYFPAVKEVNNLSFIIHSNLFELSSNRQNLTETPINKNLLRLLSKYVIEKMESSKTENRSTFKNLFTSILMSEEPSSNSSGNGWQSEYFHNILLEYIQKAIPTKDNHFSNNSQNVKINKIDPKLKIDLAEFGLNHIQWFEWDDEADRLLIDEAVKAEKLGIKEWDIRDVIENANHEDIDKWIENCDNETYIYFLNELRNSQVRIPTRIKLCNVKLFKFSDGKYYSLNEITGYDIRRFDGNSGNYLFLKITDPKDGYIFHLSKTKNIDIELTKLGFTNCDLEISKFKKDFFNDNWIVYYYDKINPEKGLYENIANKCKTNNLSSQEKKKLFLNFINEKTKFDNVSDEALKKLELFCNCNSEIKPLNKLIGNITTPSWLNAYKIEQDEYFAELNPFLISETWDIFTEIYRPNQDCILAELTTVEEIKSLIKLYQDHKVSFFGEFIIKKVDKIFVIDKKTSDTCQVQSADTEARKFLDGNCNYNLFVLPYEFLEFKDEVDIIKADDLYSLILEFVDVDEHKDILVDIVKYKAKHKFLQKLSEFRFNSETEYTEDDYEYKILDLACSVLEENDYKKFKDKVVIETENHDLKLSEIPPFADKIKIDEYEISLAKILPNNYENSDNLSDLINQFIGLGLNKERIVNLFGISEETEPSVIYQIFSEQVEKIENAEQLAFILLCKKYMDVNLDDYEILAKNGEYYNLNYDFYINEFDFITDDAILDKKYYDVIEIIKKYPINIHEDNHIYLKPCFIDGVFACPYIKDNLLDEEKISLVDFLFNQWNKKNKKTVIKNNDWTKIDDVETYNILGFNPKISVYPSKYACKSEVLPDYVIKWIDKDKTKIDFFSDIGVWTENSVIVELRKYLTGKIKDFHNKLLSQETRFIEDETTLFNSFEWLKENEITLKSEEQFKTFKKVIDVINENRINYGNIENNEEFDFEMLEENATEWGEAYYVNWKEQSKIYIFLYEGEMPKSFSLDEIADYVFYSFCDGNSAVDDNNNIYINQNADIKKELRKLELEYEDFDFDGLWQNKIEVLEKENAQLRNSNDATLGTEFSTDITKNDQKEANREAKEIVKEKLEKEGFEFTDGIGKYSTIDGVFSEEVEFPLVVKSYKYQDEPLKIGANEWKQLMRPNSVFCVHFGNRKIGYLELGTLLRTQDKLTISFSTENLDIEDRLEKFAELLHYFGNVHFDFNSLIPSKVATDFRHFSERRTEEDLTGDDDSLL